MGSTIGDGGRVMVAAGKDGELNLLGRFFRAMLLNLLRDPRKARTLEKMEMAVAVEPPRHPEQALTLLFFRGRVTVQNGLSPLAHIVLRGEPALLMKLARMPAGPAALRFLATREGRELVSGMLSRELRIKGMLCHPLRLLRFSYLMAPQASGGGEESGSLPGDIRLHVW